MNLFNVLDRVCDVVEEVLAITICAFTIAYIILTMMVIASTGTALASSDTEVASPQIKVIEEIKQPTKRGITTKTNNVILVSETLVGLGSSTPGLKSLIEQQIAPLAAESEQVPTIQASVKPEPETELMTESESELTANDYPYDEGQAVALAQLMYAEARGCSKREQSMVAWTVLNRVDIGFDGQEGFWAVITAPYQFAYNVNGPFEQYEYEMATEILRYWAAEKDGIENSIRTLPHEYIYYHANAEHTHNMFGITESQSELWFGLPDPYQA